MTAEEVQLRANLASAKQTAAELQAAIDPTDPATFMAHDDAQMQVAAATEALNTFLAILATNGL